jgi:membrane fusion protein, multidrug efflux system
MKQKWIFLGCTGALALSGCSDKPAQQGCELPPVPVQTAHVEMRDVPLFFEAIGIIQPAHTVVVKPQVTGLIKEVHFTDGEEIEEGALLYTLEEAPYMIRVLEAEAQRDQNLVHLSSAQKKLERYKSLTKQDLIAPVEWDELEAKVALHEAIFKADEARLASAELDLEQCTIRAPISGFAGKSLLQPGNRATGEPLVTLTQRDPLFVDFSITERELSQITTSSPSIHVYAAGSEELLALGRVTFMDHAIDSRTGMLAVTAQVEKEQRPLWPGQSVRVHLHFGKKEKALLVPVRAVRTNQNGPYLFTVKADNTVEMHAITLGPEEKGYVVVEEGVEGTHKIVTEGQLRLFPGSKIEEITQEG